MTLDFTCFILNRYPVGFEYIPDCQVYIEKEDEFDRDPVELALVLTTAADAAVAAASVAASVANVIADGALSINRAVMRAIGLAMTSVALRVGGMVDRGIGGIGGAVDESNIDLSMTPVERVRAFYLLNPVENLRHGVGQIELQLATAAAHCSGVEGLISAIATRHGSLLYTCAIKILSVLIFFLNVHYAHVVLLYKLCTYVVCICFLVGHMHAQVAWLALLRPT